MKIGLRKPNIKKRIKARTTGKLKRKVKGTINPLYGKKGMGWINDPKRALYNKVYNKTTFSVDDVLNYNQKNGISIFKIILMIMLFPLVLLYYFFKLIRKSSTK